MLCLYHGNLQTVTLFNLLINQVFYGLVFIFNVLERTQEQILFLSGHTSSQVHKYLEIDKVIHILVVCHSILEFDD